MAKKTESKANGFSGGVEPIGTQKVANTILKRIVESELAHFSDGNKYVVSSCSQNSPGPLVISPASLAPSHADSLVTNPSSISLKGVW